MAVQILPYDTSWRDNRGFVGRVRVHISTDDSVSGFRDDVATVALAVQAAIVNITNAVFQSSNGLDSIGDQPLGYGASATYAPEWTKCVMTFSTANGSISRFKIPSPKLAILEPDQFTVENDGTVATVVAYVAAMKGLVNGTFICSKAGLAFTHFEGGLVKIGKSPKRINGRVKSADLEAGEP